MAKKRGRGGYRQPSKPAAVSGPGSLSQRTDGGAGNSKQPIRRIPGVAYGEQKGLSEQQAAAPLPVAQQGQIPVGNTAGVDKVKDVNKIVKKVAKEVVIDKKKT